MNFHADKIVVFVARPRFGGGHELLLLRRQNTGYLDNTWHNVRGSIEGGETAPAAALRELWEETGLRPTEFYRVASMETFYDLSTDGVWHSAAFLAIVPHDVQVVLNEEHDALRWIDAADAERHLMWPSEKLLVREIRQELLVDSLCKPHLRVHLPLL